MKFTPSLIISSVLALFAAATPALAQQGGTVTSGDAVISNPTPTVTQINQTTEKAIIQWVDFSIAQGNSAIFNQPSASSITLNRVTGDAPSSILGSLQANGQVWILNPNGILFGQSATINVGALVASTLSLSDSDFHSGNYRLLQDPSKAASYVVNQGSITATSFAALIAPVVENSGSITSNGGQVYLLGTGEAILDISGTGLIGYSIGNVSGQTVHIRPDALSDVVKAAVNTSGLVEAGSIVDDGTGVIRLVGAGGLAVNTGTISVSGSSGLSGGTVVINSTNASINTWGSTINANGNGLASNGGTIQILSQDDAYFRGTITANGGTTGNGGLIEVSAPDRVWFFGTANAAAPGGVGGTLIIDPVVLTIFDGGGPNGLDNQFSVVSPGQILASDANGNDGVSETVLEGFGGANILLQASNTITMEDLADDLLDLQATTNVTFQVTTNGGAGIVFQDTTDEISTATGGATLTLNSLTDLALGNLSTANDNITLDAQADITFEGIDAGTGDVDIATTAGSINGTSVVANDLILDATAGVTIAGGTFDTLDVANTTSGAVSITDTVATLTVNAASNVTDITITTSADLAIAGNVNASAGNVTLNVTGDLSQSAGTITGGSLLVTADTVTGTLATALG
ncbi:MAG TPA: filamentous hemagglutinin N-terminal domain-containing protein, partial [Planctomycetota bacterium]|nr:filamentous hemagglutinin N-terminal domain-containing protein [Planctomycetota bacterium]